jgi:nitroreductase
MDLVDVMLSRRSLAALAEPGPTPEQLDRILRAATTVPDHGNLRPYRFVVVSGEQRARFGDALASAAAARRPDLPDEIRTKVRTKAFVAPTLIALVAAPRPGSKIETWEQVASAACCGYAMVLAAHGLGLGAMWKSTPFQRGGDLDGLLGLGADDALLGWVNLGQPNGTPPARKELDLGSLAAELTDDALVPFSPA